MSNLSELLPSGGGQNAVDFVASGTLPNGKPVILKADGTVEAIAETATAESIPAGSAVVFNTGSTAEIKVAFDPNTANKFVVAYKDSSSSSYGQAIVGTVSGTSVSFGTEVVFNSGTTDYTSIAFDPNTANKFVVTYKDNGNSNYGTAIVGTVSGTSVSFGTAVVFNSGTTNYTSISFDPNTSGKFVVTYSDAGGVDNYGTAIVGTVSGTTITFGSESVFKAASTKWISASFDPNTAGKFVVAYQDSADSEHGKALVGTMSGTSLSYGSEATFYSGACDLISAAFDPNTAGKLVVVYSDDGNSRNGTATVGTVSSTSVSFGTAVIFNAGTTMEISMGFDLSNSGKFAVTFNDWSNSQWGTAIVGTLSGTSTSYGTKAAFTSSVAGSNSISFDPNTSGKFVVTYRDNGNSSYGTAIVGQIAASLTNLTSTNFIGITAEAISSAATGSVNVYGGINEVQTGLTIGSDYYAQADGTITTTSTSPAVKVGQAISATTINMVDFT